MANRPRILIMHILEDLEPEDLEKFKGQMREQREDSFKPEKFRRAQLRGKDCQQLADLLVDSLSDHAVPVTVWLLRAIDCNDAANSLEKEAKNLPAANSQSSRGASAAVAQTGAASYATAQREHFVDRHRNALVSRVSNISPILDHLLQKKVLQQEQYDTAMDKGTTQAQMRFLFSGPLKSGGKRAKDELLSALEAEEQFLIEDLREREG